MSFIKLSKFNIKYENLRISTFLLKNNTNYQTIHTQNTRIITGAIDLRTRFGLMTPIAQIPTPLLAVLYAEPKSLKDNECIVLKSYWQI